jgi:glycosyltransferase involved in cell wall biosynthesis
MLALDTPHEFVLLYEKPQFVGTYGNGGRVREIVVETPSLWPGRKLVMRRMNDLLWDQLAMWRIEEREKLDLIFNPKYSLPLGARCAGVFACHGLDVHVRPSGARWFDRLNHHYLLPRYAHKADAIIAISNTVRQHVIEYLGVDEDRVHRVYYGVDEDFRRSIPQERLEETRRTYELPDRFFLYCGQIYPPKNFGRLIRAYARVGPELGIYLVVAGKHTQTKLCEEEIALIDKLGISPWVVQSGWIDRDALPAFYALAEALLLPSLYEGFGLPLVEAMASGAPVVTSNRYATQEVVGQAGILVDPEDVDSIADGMHRVATDRNLRQQLVEAGRERARAFSWKKCAQETIQVLEKVLARRQG